MDNFDKLYKQNLLSEETKEPLDEGVLTLMSDVTEGILKYYMTKEGMYSVWQLAIWATSQKNPPQDLLKAVFIALLVAGGNQIKNKISKMDQQEDYDLELAPDRPPRISRRDVPFRY